MALMLATAVTMGAAADFATRLVGFSLPPLFTAIWGGGALLLILRSTLKIRENSRRDAATTYDFGIRDARPVDGEVSIQKSAA